MIADQRNNQNGMTLIEIMIALTLSIIISTAFMQIYVSSKQSHQVNNNIIRMQEEGQFALELLTRDIRMAGFSPVNDARNIPDPLANALVAMNNSGLNGSDSISVRYTSGLDCVNNPVNAGITVNAYSIALGANGRSALFCNNSELVANVDNMQLAYGVDNDGDFSPEHYLTADLVADMSTVVSVRIAILVSSGAAVRQSTNSKIYHLAGTDTTPANDKYLRRVYSGTIRFRNCLRVAC